ncbi:MAG: hypothetical protein WC979_01075 [Candidatus Pacearchaeota archaeon]|jgi:hypothetical protein|nr:hypothetical protein [Clostridia bacterium]
MEINIEKVNSHVLNYINKTSQHLFVTPTGMFLKVFTVKTSTETLCVKLKFNDKLCNVSIWKIEERNKNSHYVTQLLIDGKDQSAANVAKHAWKHEVLFYAYEGPVKSIKNFKLMKEKIEEIKRFLSIKNEIAPTDGQIKGAITKILDGLTPRK